MDERLPGADSRKGKVRAAADFLEFPGDFRRFASNNIENVFSQVIESARPALQKFDEDETEFASFQPQRQRNRG